MKLLHKGLFFALLLSLLCTFAHALSSVPVTFSPVEITSCSAKLGGYLYSTENSTASYGIELWTGNDDKKTIEMGKGDIDGEFSKTVYCMDSTAYSFRAYAKGENGDISCGEIQSFTTLKSKSSEAPCVNLDIDVEKPENIDIATQPNRFFLNNLIVNNPQTLQLIAGNNFDGIDGIMQCGGKNIFINQYFMNEYYTEPILRPLLSIFDGAVYNRDDFVWDAFTTIILPTNAAYWIYNTDEDGIKSILSSIYGDMATKRFTDAVNNVLNADYTSSDRRTFGYDKSNYKIINALAEGHDTAKEVIKNFKDGKEKLIEGIEDYQGYYFDTIMPKYSGAQYNFMQMNKYLMNNSKNMTADEINQNLKYAHAYADEISGYEALDFVDENARKWKLTLEENYFCKEAFATLNKLEKPISLAGSSLGTLKTINQVQNNKDELYGTFTRLRDNTENKRLKVTLDDYIIKMDNGFAAFLGDTVSNIYNVYFKNTVQEKAYAEVKKLARKTAAENLGSYTVYATDKALAKANYLAIAADVGGVFAEQISSTKTLLEKAIEAKYLWNIENESKLLLKADLEKYQEDSTEENAKNVLDDLFWIKSLKLRELTVAKELYNANGDNWLSLADTKLGAISDGVDEIFTSQSDALINASLTETRYTSEPLALGDGETCLVSNFNTETGSNGALISGGETTLLKNADSRLAGGIVLYGNSTLNISASDREVYIPFVYIDSGATLIVSGGNVTIGEFTQGRGQIVIAEGSRVHIKGDIELSSDFVLSESELDIDGNLDISKMELKLDNARLSVSGTLNQFRGRLSVGSSTVNLGNYHLSAPAFEYGYFDAGSGTTNVSGNFTVETNLYGKSYILMQDDRAYVCVGGTFKVHTSNSNTLLTAGTLELKGDFVQDYFVNYSTTETFICSGTHKTIFSGTDVQNISFASIDGPKFAILESTNPKANFVNMGNADVVTGKSYFTNLFLLSMRADDNAEINVSGNLTLGNRKRGNISLGNAKVNVGGDMSVSAYEFKAGNANITVKGGLSQSSGDIFVENASLDLGSYYVNSFSTEKGSFDLGQGSVRVRGDFNVESRYNAPIYLKMTDDRCYLCVEGNFRIYTYNGNSYLTAGTLELKGNFTQDYNYSFGTSANFRAADAHRTILSGNRVQNIVFGSSNSYFNILVNKNEQAVFNERNYSKLYSESPYIVRLVKNNGESDSINIVETSSSALVKDFIAASGNLTNKDCYFRGWYRDKNFTEEYTEENNSVLSDVTLYAKWEKPLEITDVSRDEKGVISVGIKAAQEICGNSVIIALYDGERLSELKIAVLSESEVYTFESGAVGNSVTVIVLSNLDSLKPICESVSGNIQPVLR